MANKDSDDLMIKTLAGELQEGATREEIEKFINESSDPGTAREYYKAHEIRQAMLNDMDYFAGTSLPDVAVFKFPDFYRYVWLTLLNALMTDKMHYFVRFAIALPRGHGKTMVIKLLVVAVVVFTKRKYVMVIGANKNKAMAIVGDVAGILSSPNIVSLFGNWTIELRIDRADKKVFAFNGRTVILEAAGYGTAIRGSQEDNSRPDFVIFDDAQTKENAESLVESAAFRSWFRATAMRIGSMTGCVFVYIGNMYKDIELEKTPSGKVIYCCNLRNLQFDPLWETLIVGGILDDGTALWEELAPLDFLLEDYESEREAGTEDIFMAEVMNTPIKTSSKYFMVEKIRHRDDLENEWHQGNFIVIDPATSKLTPDQIVVFYHEVYDGVPVGRELLQSKDTTLELIRKVLEMALRWNCDLIFVEANAYQYVLVELLDAVLAQYNLTDIRVVPIYSTKNKNSKILQFFKAWQAGEYSTTEEVRNILQHQALEFNPSVTNNLDDVVDGAAMALQCYQKYTDMLTIPDGMESTDRLTLPSELS